MPMHAAVPWRGRGARRVGREGGGKAGKVAEAGDLRAFAHTIARERSASLLSNCSSLAEKEALATSQILRLPSPAGPIWWLRRA